MKHFIFLLFAAAVMNSCATGTNDINAVDSNNILTAGVTSAAPAGGHSLSGRWNLIPALPSDTAAGRLPFIQFDTSTKRVSGNTGCNSFSGSYLSSADSLRFSKDMITTKMACTGFDENAFLSSLSRVNHYRLQGDTLVLQSDATPLSYWLKVK